MMTLTIDEQEALQFLLDSLDVDDSRLSDWERGFLEDQKERYEKHGSAIFLSGKQWAVLNRINEKLGAK